MLYQHQLSSLLFFLCHLPPNCHSCSWLNHGSSPNKRVAPDHHTPYLLLLTPDLLEPLEFLKTALISIKVWHFQGDHIAASSPLQRTQQIPGNHPLFSLTIPHLQSSRTIFFLPELCFGFSSLHFQTCSGTEREKSSKLF